MFAQKQDDKTHVKNQPLEKSPIKIEQISVSQLKNSKLTFPSSSKKKILFSSRLQITSPHLGPQSYPETIRGSAGVQNPETEFQEANVDLISFVDEHIQTMGFEEI